MPDLPQMHVNDFLLLIGDQQVTIRRLMARISDLEAEVSASKLQVQEQGTPLAEVSSAS